MDSLRIGVIGAGIVGTVSALYLARDGHDVVLIDRDEPGEGCSFGNAGLLARSSFAPIAGPDTLKSVPKWILDPDGPLSIRWRYLPKLLPWLVRFVHSGLHADQQAAASALQVLCDPCVELYKALAGEAGCPDLIRESDYLQIYRSRSNFEKAAGDMNLRRRFGIRIEEVGAEVIRELEPGLSPEFEYGYRIHDHGYVLNPGKLVKQLAGHFEECGGTFMKADVSGIRSDEERVTVLSNGDEIESDRLVVAAGAFSKLIGGSGAEHTPLDTERGYHITCPEPGVSLSRPVMEGDRKFLATPMEMGLRFAGTVELGDLRAPPNRHRSDLMFKHARRMVPGLNTAGASTWMGRRPTFPDSLPAIGPLPSDKRIVFAFGHQHIGLTGAPKTAEIVSALLNERHANMNIEAYSPARFV